MKFDTKEEKNKLRSKYGITAEEEAPFVMPQERDYSILRTAKLDSFLVLSAAATTDVG
jgi:hypothetical protein